MVRDIKILGTIKIMASILTSKLGVLVGLEIGLKVGDDGGKFESVGIELGLVVYGSIVVGLELGSVVG